MSGFVPEKRHTFEFEGDTVTVVMLPLKNTDMGKLVQFAERTGEDEQGNAQFSVPPSRIGEFAEAVGNLLPEYVKEFDGLTDANGNPVDLKTACTYRHFMELMMEIGQALMVESDLKEGEGKA